MIEFNSFAFQRKMENAERASSDKILAEKNL